MTYGQILKTLERREIRTKNRLKKLLIQAETGKLIFSLSSYSLKISKKDRDIDYKSVYLNHNS